EGGSPPSNTAQALANLARDPGQNVDGIFALTLLSNLYAPPLVTMPDAWTVTVKINDSGSDDLGFLISGPGNLAFDRRGFTPGSRTTRSKEHHAPVGLIWYLSPTGSRPMVETARLGRP